MANILNVWPITSNPTETRTVELLALPTEDGAGSFWVDQRDEFGRLVASEPFDSQGAAREHAMSIVSPFAPEWIN